MDYVGQPSEAQLELEKALAEGYQQGLLKKDNLPRVGMKDQLAKDLEEAYQQGILRQDPAREM